MSKSKPYSYFLVFIQFFSIFAMFASSWHLITHLPTIIFLIVGLGIGLTAVGDMKKFNIIPEIHHEASLVRHGIYRYVRHPMYFSLLVAFFGFFLFGGLATKLFYLLMFGAVFLKAKKEEQLWCEKDKEYLRYKEETKMLFPFLF